MTSIDSRSPQELRAPLSLLAAPEAPSALAGNPTTDYYAEKGAPVGDDIPGSEELPEQAVSAVAEGPSAPEDSPPTQIEVVAATSGKLAAEQNVDHEVENPEQNHSEPGVQQIADTQRPVAGGVPEETTTSIHPEKEALAAGNVSETGSQATTPAVDEGQDEHEDAAATTDTTQPAAASVTIPDKPIEDTAPDEQRRADQAIDPPAEVAIKEETAPEQDTVIGGDSGNGIPAEVFTSGYENIVTTPSGHQFKCSATEDWVIISDNLEESGSPADGDHYFLAWMDTRGDDINVGFSVRTEVEGVRHPDLFASRLLGKATEYFEGNLPPGERVANIQGNWSDSTEGEGSSGHTRADNLRLYNQTLAAQGNRPYSAEQRAIAAKATKTGRMAERIGFSYVDGAEVEEHEPSHHVTAKFWRPECYAEAHS
jgi:hypothetical protein